ncbi:hypothetical protein BHE74_00034947, partial [Ensete ventricosum]
CFRRSLEIAALRALSPFARCFQSLLDVFRWSGHEARCGCRHRACCGAVYGGFHENFFLFGGMTLPAGFLEIGESAAEGAARETLEEACAEVEIISPFAQLDIPLIGQYIEDINSGNLKFHYCTINKR